MTYDGPIGTRSSFIMEGLTFGKPCVHVAQSMHAASSVAALTTYKYSALTPASAPALLANELIGSTPKAGSTGRRMLLHFSY